jgi:rod shape determining protein RodA
MLLFQRAAYGPEGWLRRGWVRAKVAALLALLVNLLVVVGFVVWIWRLLQIAGRARSDVESLVVVGIGAMVMFQVVVNINMTIGLGPITGIPLPWLSYGRSAMLVNFIALGLCASVARRGSTSTGRW